MIILYLTFLFLLTLSDTATDRCMVCPVHEHWAMCMHHFHGQICDYHEYRCHVYNGHHFQHLFGYVYIPVFFAEHSSQVVYARQDTARCEDNCCDHHGHQTTTTTTTTTTEPTTTLLPVNYETILVGTPGTIEGQLYLRNPDTGHIAEVCADGWTDRNSIVVCNNLSFPSSNTQYKAVSRTDSYEIALNHVTCDGTEASVDQCQHDRLPCTGNMVVYVICGAGSSGSLLG